VALTWGIARRLWDPRVAAWAAGVVAVVPALVWLPAALLAETLFTPLVLGAVLCLLVHRDRPAWGWVAAAGALIALAALTRSNGVVLLLPVLAGAWVARRRAADAGIALVCAVVVLLPWTIRNAGALGSFSPLGTQSGFTMAGAWNAEAAKDGAYFAAWRVPIDLPVHADLTRQPGTTEADVDRALRSRALDYAADHPGFVLRSTAVHLGRLFHLGPDQGPTDDLSLREMGVPEGHRFELRWGTWALVLLAVAGAVVLRRRSGPRRVPLWLWSVPVLLLAGVAPLLGPPRYRVPLDPFLALPAGVALAALATAVTVRMRGAAGSG
jgi:4-amino-4-deoxy-L-arabinose transferase-like glycosyltransferase